MKLNKRNASGLFLLLGLACLALGLATDNPFFSWAAIALVLISLVLGSRWMRPGKK